MCIALRAVSVEHFPPFHHVAVAAGTGAWKDDGKEFGVATHAEDLAKFISALNTGPVHLVGWSYGGVVAATAAVKNPSLVLSLTVYEPTLLSVLPAEAKEGKVARDDLAKIVGPAIEASKIGDIVRAVRLMFEGVYQLPPGGFDRAPQMTRTMVLDQARTLPLLFAAPPPAITCDMLKNFTRPTLVIWGERTQPYFALISERSASVCRALSGPFFKMSTTTDRVVIRLHSALSFSNSLRNAD